MLNKLKRLYYRLKNSDPIKKCPVYLKEGCSHVDGPYCSFPGCSLVREFMGHSWISCCECRFQDECSSNQFGNGCFDGEKKE